MEIFISTLAVLALLIVLAFALSQSLLAFRYATHKSAEVNATGKTSPIWQSPLPRVLLQLPLFNEVYVVERLLSAVRLLDYPANLLTIQILDDSTDGTSTIIAAKMRGMRARGLNVHQIKRDVRTGYKAGALQAGLALDDSEFVAIFDADFVPRPDFLKKVMGYFSDGSIGMVQTRWEHLNKNDSLLTKLLSFGIDAHFSIEQGGRQAYGAFINFNGTAGMWRRKAIDAAGGWSSDCLTEDLDLSFRAQLQGWRFLFVEEITTPSELPADISALRVQQFRWTKGAAETGRKNLWPLWQSTQPVLTKVVGTFHMLNSLIFPALLIFSLALAALPLFGGDGLHWLLWALAEGITLSTILVIYTYVIANTTGRLKGTTFNLPKAFYNSVMFVIMTSGLNLHNSVAVVQGLFRWPTPFMRTPKPRLKNSTEPAAHALHSYAENVKLAPIAVEATLGCLFVWCAVRCYFTAYDFLLPAYVFFALGYFTIVYFSCKELRARMQPDFSVQH